MNALRLQTPVCEREGGGVRGGKEGEGRRERGEEGERERKGERRGGGGGEGRRGEGRGGEEEGEGRGRGREESVHVAQTIYYTSRSIRYSIYPQTNSKTGDIAKQCTCKVDTCSVNVHVPHDYSVHIQC